MVPRKDRLTGKDIETKLVSDQDAETPDDEEKDGSSQGSSEDNDSVAETDFIKEENILGFTRKPHTSISVFILLTMSFINLFINKFIYNDINPLKVLLAVTPILYFNLLFLRIVKILKHFKFRDILRNTMGYFNRRFAQSVMAKNYSENRSLDYGGSVDYQDNLLYIGQMMKEIELLTYSLTRKMWPFFFGSMIIYTVCLHNYSVYWIINPKYEDHSTIMQIIGSLMTGFSAKNESLANKNLKGELESTQIIIIMLLFEILVLNHYSRMHEDVELMEEKQKNDMIDVMHKKMRYYRTRDDDTMELPERHQIEGDFIEAYRSRNLVYGSGPEKLSKFMLESLEQIQSPVIDINDSKLFVDDLTGSKPP